MGTTGTIMGVSRYLKEQNPSIVIIGCQPDEGSQIPGIRKWPEAYMPKIFDRKRVDRIENVSQADAEATARILGPAGFDEMRFEDVHEPVFYGHDLDAALAFVRGFQDTSMALASVSDGEAARIVERLREMLAAYYRDGRGVVLDSRSWLITARRRR
jgi:hypothetical protein